MLIAARALLGVAGATVAPSTLSLIRNMFHDPGQRTFAIGVWGTSYSVGGAIGPPLGGVLLEYFWWGSVFLLAVPVMALVLVLGPQLLPEYRDPSAGRPDFVSAALSLIAVLAVIYGLKQIAENGAGWLPVLSIVAGAPRRRGLLAAPARAGRSPDRSPSLQIARLQRFGRRPTCSASSSSSVPSCSSRSISSSCSGCRRLQAGLWTLPVVHRRRLRLHAGSNDRTTDATAIRDRRRPRPCRDRPRRAQPGRHRRQPGDPGRRLGGPFPRTGAGFHPHRRPDHGLGAARARRRSRGDLGDGRRARRRPRHSHPRQPRHRRLPERDGARHPGRRPSRSRRRPREIRSAVPSPPLGSSPARSAASCSSRPAPHSRRGSS